MSIVLRARELFSRAMRYNSAQGNTGRDMIENAVGTGQILTQPPRQIERPNQIIEDQQGGFLEQIWNGGGNFVNWALGGLNNIRLSFVDAWEWLQGRTEQIKQFNWNATDEQLDLMSKSLNVQTASIWGGFLGQTAGWLGGIAFGAGVGLLCPVIGGGLLATTIASKVTLEAIDELGDELLNAVGQTINIWGTQLSIWVYKNYRSLIKRVDRDTLSTIYGEEQADWIKDKWGEKGEPEISFNNWMDEQVESQDPVSEAFWEEFFEESWDSFVEAGFVIAHELDETFAQTNQAQEANEEPERTLEVEPDREDSEETFVYQDVPQDQLMATVQSDINQYRVVQDRDVGGIIGEPVSDYLLRALPYTRKLTIEFRDRERPPWSDPETKEIKQVKITIPDAKKGLTWNEIKNTAKPYMWGEYRATAKLNNGRQMAVYGSSPQEAESTLKQLLYLSEAEINALSISEEKERPAQMKKKPTRVYPAFVSLLFRKNTTSNDGKTLLDGKTVNEETIRVPLYPVSKPESAKELEGK